MALFIATLSSAMGHLGETPDEIETRFGPEVAGETKFFKSMTSSRNSVGIHSSRGFLIEILFRNGKSVSEAYIAQKDADGTHRSLDGFLTVVLEAAGEGQEWKSDQYEDAIRYFRADDKVMVLRCHDNYVVVSDMEGYKKAKSK